MHTRSRPGRSACLAVLRPRTDSPKQRDLTVRGLHADALSIGLRVAYQCLFDLLLDPASPDRRRDPDLIVYTFHPDETAHRPVCRLTLELIGDLATEGEHSTVCR